MNYLGFGMRKEVYDRKPKEVFAIRKFHNNGEVVLKHAEITEQPIPQSSILRQETTFQKFGKYAKLVLLLLLLLFVAAFLLAIFHSCVG